MRVESNPREMFIVNLKEPSRPVKTVLVTVKVCDKTVWAIREDGRRHLVGSSAFQTLAAAERCRLALLQKIVDDPGSKYYRPYALQSAERALARAAKVLH